MIQKSSNWIVFRELMNNPMKKFHIREISRNIKLAPTSVKKHIDTLIKEKLVFEKKDDVFKYYIANFESELFRFYKRINSLILLKESGLINYLNNTLTPNSMVLFGSMAKGEDTQESDIDIFVQTQENKVMLGQYEDFLKRKIQLFFFSDLKSIPKELRNNIINGIKLEGYIQLWN